MSAPILLAEKARAFGRAEWGQFELDRPGGKTCPGDVSPWPCKNYFLLSSVKLLTQLVFCR